MALEYAYASLRWGHFLSLMLAFGCVIYAAWWAEPSLRRLMEKRFNVPLRTAFALSAGSATLILMLQGGLMGDGWQDVIKPEVWQAVAGTQFGTVWLWPIVLAWVCVAVIGLCPPRRIPLLFILCLAQFMLMASVGHAAMRDGPSGVFQRLNHAVHLLCTAAWFGGLFPFLYCLKLAKGRWRGAAIATMMRFSRYGHLAVAGAIGSGIANAYLIQGTLFSDSRYGKMLLLKSALVAMMVIIALANRYILVPRMATDRQRSEALFLRATQAELILGALVLATVSLFATWEPF